MFVLFVILQSLLLSSCSYEKNENNATVGTIVVNETVVQEPLIENDSPIHAVKEDAPYYNQYTVAMKVEPGSRQFSVIEKVNFKNMSDDTLKEIYLNVYLNAFSRESSYKPYFQNFEKRIFAQGKDYSEIAFQTIQANNKDVSYSLKDTVLKIELNEPIAPGHEAEITLQFEAYVPKISHRTGANDKAIWCGNFLPILAVYDEDGWHTAPYYAAGDPFFSEISNYDVSITAPSDYMVIGTGTEKSTEAGGEKTTQLTANMVRDFAFALSKHYIPDTIKVKEIEINFYHYTENPANLTQLMDICQKSVTYLTEKVGSYPYQTLDIVEGDLFIEGDMEYPQFVIADSRYLAKKRSIYSLAHEISHQWFYNIIGNNQVREPWIDEGMTMFIQQGIYSSEREIDESFKNHYNNLKISLEQQKQKNLEGNLGVYESWAEYYNTQYTRSKLMFYSLYKKMGTEKFDIFLKSYYEQYSFKIVNKDKLITLCEEVYEGDLTDFFDGWISQDKLPDL